MPEYFSQWDVYVPVECPAKFPGSLLFGKPHFGDRLPGYPAHLETQPREFRRIGLKFGIYHSLELLHYPHGVRLGNGLEIHDRIYASEHLGRESLHRLRHNALLVVRSVSYESHWRPFLLALFLFSYVGSHDYQSG